MTPIAAGEKVVASNVSSAYRFIRKHYGDAVAIEMEGTIYKDGSLRQTMATLLGASGRLAVAAQDWVTVVEDRCPGRAISRNSSD